MPTKKIPVKKEPTKKTSAKKAVATKKPAEKKVVEKKLKPTSEGFGIPATAKGIIKTIGRRKRASAQVRVIKGDGKIIVNKKTYQEYFPTVELQARIDAVLDQAGQKDKLDISALVKGGGVRGQADAVRLGIARALLIMDENLRTTLRKGGFLTRDARVKERKKYGLKGARRAPQFSKR